MLKFFKTIDGKLMEREDLEDGAWISVVSPTEAEKEYLLSKIGLDSGFLISSLDEEETPRVEVEEGQTLIILDVPVTGENENNTISYTTVPMGFILTESHLITICSRFNKIIADCEAGVLKNASTVAKIRFFLNICLRITSYYHQYLRAIDKLSVRIEKQIHESMRNEELFQMMALAKTLVYFSTSLKADELCVEKLMRGRVIKLMEEDSELLEDVLIEMKQAMDMSSIYQDVLSGMMDAFASIISNNLNVVMKVLTSLTIVIAIPSAISGFYGMNVEHIPFPFFWVPIALTVGVCGLALFLLNRKGMLK